MSTSGQANYNATALQKEREEIYHNILNGKTPSRIPVQCPIGMEAAVDYSNMHPGEVNWDMTKLEAVFDKVCEDFPTDVPPGVGRRIPSYYQLLGSKPIQMGSSGVMQHPNIEGMTVDDYDALIASPYDCIIDTILPRLYTELDADPNKKAMALAKSMKAYNDEFAVLGGITAKLRAKYGFIMMNGGLTTAPFDFLADFFRSFTGVSKDIRRMPEKVVEACEALTPLLIKKGKPMGPSTFGQVMIPLHMGPYMREKDFEKFYWPTLKKQVEAINEMGINVGLFVEHDYMRFLDYLYDLPENTVLRFEYGDPKIIKEKLGKKHVISGFYPLMMLHSNKKSECVDKAKELIDALAPGGKFIFDFDKSAFDMSGNIVENLQAVLEYVRVHGKYDNYDKPEPYNDFDPAKLQRRRDIVAEIDKGIHSKYYTPWSQYKEKHPELPEAYEHVIAPKMQSYEDTMFNFIINLCS